MERYMINYVNFTNSMVDGALVKSVFSAICLSLANFFGADWWIIKMLLILIFADFTLGMVSAIKIHRRLSGQRLHDGVIKVIAYCTAIILTWTVQEIVLHTIPVELPILAFFAGYQSLTEIQSISRHLSKIGIPMPKLFFNLTNRIEASLDKKLSIEK